MCKKLYYVCINIVFLDEKAPRTTTLIRIQCSVLRLELPTRGKNTQIPNFFKIN